MLQIVRTSILGMLVALAGSAATVVPVQAQVCAPAQPCGDINASDDVTVADALLVLRRSIGLSADMTCSCTGGEECPAGGVTKTLQTMCWDPLDIVAPINPIDCDGTGQDGENQSGLVPDIVDNGNGTISDARTTLMWEKLTNDSGIHDYDNFSYQWAGAYDKMDNLNNVAFAGHTDWRLPTVRELATLIDYSKTNPAVSSMFNLECLAGCTEATCSCTYLGEYWTSTTNQASPQNAWVVDFRTGTINPNGGKAVYKYVRAVRGGY